KPCCLTYATFDLSEKPSQEFRTLFLQEMIRQGVIPPSFVISYAHTNAEVDRTIEAVDHALKIYAKALQQGVENYLVGRSVKPVFRRYN
ncbi:MAG: glutamate-1-semialdehyde 2,1-aminomutase, partial [Verrucomicrobia bacterium]|nr:glutamate-1-semialdehyde 2,1-aminomutase [Verrucomicrobiota bacterium]